MARENGTQNLVFRAFLTTKTGKSPGNDALQYQEKVPGQETGMDTGQGKGGSVCARSVENSTKFYPDQNGQNNDRAPEVERETEGEGWRGERVGVGRGRRVQQPGTRMNERLIKLAVALWWPRFWGENNDWRPIRMHRHSLHPYAKLFFASPHT